MNQDLYNKLKGAYLQASDARSFDITNLYLTMERTFDEYLSAGLAKEGESFVIDTGAHIGLRFKFFKKCTEIYMMNYEEGEEEFLILSKEASAKKELATLSGVEQTLRALKLPLGLSFPKELKNVLLQAEPGTVLSFTEGKSYVCENNNHLFITLREVFDGNIENINLQNFAKRKSIVLNYASEPELQKFYSLNKKALSQSMEVEYSVLDKARIQVKQYEKDISILHSKNIRLGPVSLVGKKGMRGVKWYASDGQSVTGEQLSFLIGLLNTQPIQTKYVRKQPTYEKTAEDSDFRKSVEHLLDAHNYSLAYQNLLEYSKKNGTDLTIETKCILKKKDGFSDIKIVFHNGKGYILSFQDNDLSSAKPLSEKDFSSFCDKKYTETFKRIYAEALEEIQQKYQNSSEQVKKIQEAIAKNLTNRKLSETHGIVFAEEDITLGSSEHSDVLENIEDDNSISFLLRR